MKKRMNSSCSLNRPGIRFCENWSPTNREVRKTSFVTVDANFRQALIIKPNKNLGVSKETT